MASPPSQLTPVQVATAPPPWWAPYVIGAGIVLGGAVMLIIRPADELVAVGLITSGLTFLGVGHGAVTTAAATAAAGP